MSKTSFYSDRGVTPNNINAIEDSKNAAAVSEANAESHKNAAAQHASDANTAKLAAQASEAGAETARTGAETAETGAASSATSAANSAATATTKASESSASAASAATSATGAHASATSAASEADDAAVNATASETSRVASVAAQTASETAQTAAETAETNAATLATNAASSESNAASSASAAASSATTSSTKAGEAAASASNASASETNAASSAIAASGSETAAAASATAASGSAITASTKASEASSSAAAASSSAANASTYESNASTSATNAATSETNASNSASAAATSASNASTSETNAAASATTATNARTAAEAARDTALAALSSGLSSVNRAITRTQALSGQQTFHPRGGYTTGYLDVYWNGVRLADGIDFTASNGASITVGAPTGYGDVIEMIAWGTTDSGTAPTISEVSGTINTDAPSDLTITGTGFTSGATVQLINYVTGSILRNSPTVTVNTPSEIVAATGVTSTAPTLSGTRVTVRVTNPDGHYVEAIDVITVGSVPAPNVIPDPTADGTSSTRAAPNAASIITTTGSAVDGTYWININGTPREIYCDQTTDGGGWMLVYEITNPNRLSNGSLEFATDNSPYWGSGFTNFTRFAYRQQNNMIHGATSYYAFVSGDKFTGLNPVTIRPYDAVRRGIHQSNFNNIHVVSNYSSSHVTEVLTDGQTGRIEAWNWNYKSDAAFVFDEPNGNPPNGHTSPFTDGSTTEFDWNDTPSYDATGGYGCVQLFNMSTTAPQVLMAWNRHNSIPACVGFGTNDASNPFYTSSGDLDWTFANNGNLNFKHQGWIK